MPRGIRLSVSLISSRFAQNHNLNQRWFSTPWPKVLREWRALERVPGAFTWAKPPEPNGNPPDHHAGRLVGIIQVSGVLGPLPQRQNKAL